MEFLKGHGTGNDFILLPLGSPDLSPEQVRTLTDRHRGIGADGVLRVVQADDGYVMDYRNADGSLAEMCGNGARLFARHLVEAGLAQGSFTFGTRGGPVTAAVDGETVSIGMGRATYSRLRVAPVVTMGTTAANAVAVFVPNPHAVVLLDSLDALPAELVRPELDPVAVFPDGANVEFVARLGPDRLAMRVYERGVGETLSCGTGAVAAAVVGFGGEGPFELTVQVSGGEVSVTRDSEGNLTLTGPTQWVARGTTHLLDGA